MGYTTDFNGEITLDRPLNEAERTFLNTFSDTRRMKRDTSKLAPPSVLNRSVGLDNGKEGGFFVGAEGLAGQDRDNSIVDYNSPPEGQPSLWCQWISPDGTCIEWDGGEKFYDYTKWMEYIINSFLIPWGVVANGVIEWNGEEPDDLGQIVVKNNKVTERVGTVVYS
jgi:hypothetical protein